MADVISLNQKLKLSEKKKAAIVRKQKILAVRKVFQCTRCTLRCEKCGSQIDSHPTHDIGAVNRNPTKTVPYRFCENCLEEYFDYIERLKGRGDPDYYWHNDDWLKVWQGWIGYQNAIDQYLKSSEFTQLLNELKTNQD